ncbi:hypothetical protein GCM10009772_17940 [Pseudonocardia alni subsp. carboxydivorans]
MTPSPQKIKSPDTPGRFILREGRVGLYCRQGFSVVVQPKDSRLVGLCVRTTSTEASWVAANLRNMLDLKFDFVSVSLQENSEAVDSICTAEHLRPAEVVGDQAGRIWVAGSYLRSGYPLDSAECAARSARVAVEQILRGVSTVPFELVDVGEPEYDASRTTSPGPSRAAAMVGCGE